MGEGVHLNWLRKELENHYVLKAKVTGPTAEDEKTTDFLGRKITWTPRGITWEADRKHVKNLLKEHVMQTCNSVSTPITSDIYVDKKPGDRELRPLMEPHEATVHRRACATINYLSQDRPDLSVAACEMSKTMATPRQGDSVLVKRCLRYLRGHPRAVQLYRFVRSQGGLNLWTDSDWANCPSTRKSQSGGVLRLGVHPLKHWCRIQGKVASSSGEAEVLSANSGLSELAQFKHVYDEFLGAAWTTLDHYVDASACQAFLVRSGAGGFKHFETKDLWGQQTVHRLGVKVHKVMRRCNFSDMFASPTATAVFRNFLSQLDVVYVSELQTEVQAVAAHVKAHPQPCFAP